MAKGKKKEKKGKAVKFETTPLCGLTDRLQEFAKKTKQNNFTVEFETSFGTVTAKVSPHTVHFAMRSFKLNGKKINTNILRYLLDNEGRKNGETPSTKRVGRTAIIRTFLEANPELDPCPPKTAPGPKKEPKTEKKKGKKAKKEDSDSVNVEDKFLKKDAKKILKKKQIKKALVALNIPKNEAKVIMAEALNGSKECAMESLYIPLTHVDFPKENMREAFQPYLD